MALNFPNTPNAGDTYEDPTTKVNYVYDSNFKSWTVIGTLATPGGGGYIDKTPTDPDAALGYFGSGNYKFFFESEDFVVPAGVTKIRARCWGAGGLPGPGSPYSGFGGGGFALGIYDVNAGDTIPVTIEENISFNNFNGRYRCPAISIGSLCSATGGRSFPGGNDGPGGTGSDGNVITHDGGIGGRSQGGGDPSAGGGGGSANIFGRGGNGGGRLDPTTNRPILSGENWFSGGGASVRTDREDRISPGGLGLFGIDVNNFGGPFDLLGTGNGGGSSASVLNFPNITAQNGGGLCWREYDEYGTISNLVEITNKDIPWSAFGIIEW